MLVAERCDHDVGPEARTVFADAPALVFDTVGGGGDLQLPVRFSRLDILGRVEDREVLPDDLVLGVALQPLRARIPASNDALVVEDEDRVIGDALDEESIELIDVQEPRCPRVRTRLRATCSR